MGGNAFTHAAQQLHQRHVAHRLVSFVAVPLNRAQPLPERGPLQPCYGPGKSVTLLCHCTASDVAALAVLLNAPHMCHYHMHRPQGSGPHRRCADPARLALT
jgi:hypothetical protein